PTDQGVRQLALIKKGRNSSEFLDPRHPEAGTIRWEGRWRTLTPAYELAFTWSNYPDAFHFIDFWRLLRNTLVYALVTTAGATASAAIVAYGFARFRFPLKNVLFLVLISTIILPPQVTLVPTYAFFFRIGWVGTWLPLIVPQFFSNAYNVFLLRQYFMTIPTELDDAARVDGAGPLRTFFMIMLPQAVPALIAVSLFHFFFAWNDFFGPLVYLAGSQDLLPLSVGLFRFNGLYSAEPQLIQAASILTMTLPLLIFFLAQRFFMQGVVLTGVEK
ncbi:MAG TPA: carbohydrate ABC transporter permease, partial [Trueperaceae bacterium]